MHIFPSQIRLTALRAAHLFSFCLSSKASLLRRSDSVRYVRLQLRRVEKFEREGEELGEGGRETRCAAESVHLRSHIRFASEGT
jgi:hypothetical protein